MRQSLPHNFQLRRLLSTGGLVLTILAAVTAVALAGVSPAEGLTSRLYWGAVTGTQFDGGAQAPWNMRVISDYSREDALGKHVSLVPMYQPFADCSSSPCTWNRFPTAEFNHIRDYGAVPMVSWGSSSLQDPSYIGVRDPSFTLRAVADGSFDSYLTAYAEEAKAWGHPFFLRFDWEMNGSWFVWGNDTNSNTAAEYVAAWRHVHDIFAKVGARNATWVWCPNNGNDHGSIANLAQFYPGSADVNWTCMDAYNFGRTNGGRWRSWNAIAAPTYRALSQIAPRKPIMVGEFASDDVGGSQAAWLSRTLAEIPTRYPRIHAIVLYDTSSQWQIEANPRARAAFAAGIRPPVYAGNAFRNLNHSPIPAP